MYNDFDPHAPSDLDRNARRPRAPRGQRLLQRLPAARPSLIDLVPEGGRTIGLLACQTTGADPVAGSLVEVVLMTVTLSADGSVADHGAPVS